MDKKKLDMVSKCIAILVALVLFCVVVFMAKNYDKGTDGTYDIVCLGDSNFANMQTETGITALLSDKVGKKVLNGAFGGSMMTNSYNMKTDYYSALSMYNLAVSICNRNFGVQKSSIDVLARSGSTWYFESSLEKLSKVDFEQVDILMIEHGVNDYLSGIPIKNGVDLYDTDTFLGTIRTVVKMIQKEYPKLRIILVTPAYCAPLSQEGQYQPCDEYAYGGRYLEDYVNAELEVARELEIEMIDLYHGMDVNADNFSDYLEDGLHFNEHGRKIAADVIADYLLGEVQ